MSLLQAKSNKYSSTKMRKLNPSIPNQFAHIKKAQLNLIQRMSPLKHHSVLSMHKKSLNSSSSMTKPRYPNHSNERRFANHMQLSTSPDLLPVRDGSMKDLERDLNNGSNLWKRKQSQYQSKVNVNGKTMHQGPWNRSKLSTMLPNIGDH